MAFNPSTYVSSATIELEPRSPQRVDTQLAILASEAPVTAMVRSDSFRDQVSLVTTEHEAVWAMTCW